MLATKATLILAAAGALAATFAVPSGAYATNDLHESYTDQLQKNPALLDPNNEAARYRIGDPREGYDDRKAAQRGYYSQDSGYYPAAPRGRVVVQPYYTR